MSNSIRTNAECNAYRQRHKSADMNATLGSALAKRPVCIGATAFAAESTNYRQSHLRSLLSARRRNRLRKTFVYLCARRASAFSDWSQCVDLCNVCALNARSARAPLASLVQRSQWLLRELRKNTLPPQTLFDTRVDTHTHRHRHALTISKLGSSTASVCSDGLLPNSASVQFSSALCKIGSD